ncbi:hypothetical protein [uncultured Cyclobacterium sp.]|uniref:hypothetical protein n=1 Tax=uncultured Cyclobacterium sp. TaxID=453820 RepID=UPI0030EB1ECF
MKKLNLEKLKLAAEDVLQRNQMAGVYGGSGGSGGFGTCKAKWADTTKPGGWAVTCGWDKDTAMSIAAQQGGYYCCDSCNSSYDCSVGS